METGRRNLNMTELTENVKQLIKEAQASQKNQVDMEEGHPKLIKRRIEHCFEVEGERRWYTGTVKSKARFYQQCYPLVFLVTTVTAKISTSFGH